MDSAVVAQVFGQLVPLAATPQAVDDAVEHHPRVSSLAPGMLGRVEFPDDRLNFRPQVVRYLPDGVQLFALLHNSHHSWNVEKA